MSTAQYFVGKTVEVLIEKESKKSDQQWAGTQYPELRGDFPQGDYKVGDYVMVEVTDCTGATLIGEAIGYSDMEGPLTYETPKYGNVQSVKQRFELIGNDPTFNRAIEKALQVAPTDISVLVTGESGVGKESIPRIIHSQSFRKHAKYIAVNCGAIPEGTIDSELFGHEKGAFTGATQTRIGYFEVADGGTIFLDEVGELPLPTQVRLLRVLENGEFLKVGSSQTQKTDVRIVAATNVKMFEAIEKGKFREDLYYRLSTVEIDLPAIARAQR